MSKAAVKPRSVSVESEEDIVSCEIDSEADITSESGEEDFQQSSLSNEVPDVNDLGGKTSLFSCLFILLWV